MVRSIGDFLESRELAYISSRAVERSGVRRFPALIDAVEAAYRTHAARDVALPKSDYLRYNSRPNYDRIIPLLGHLGGAIQLSGLKQICSSTTNAARGFPRASGLIILNDPESNRPFALLEASLISAARTAAVTGLALRELVRPSMRRIAISGCGQLGRTHLHMIVDVFGADRFAYRFYDLSSAAMDSMLELAELLGVEAEPGRDARHTIEQADIVIPATTAEQPYVERSWLGADALYCAVSLLDATLDLFRHAALIIVDDLPQCLHEGRPLDLLNRRSELPVERIVEIGAYLTGAGPALPPSGQIIFNPMGTVITDLAVAKVIFDRAVSGGDYVTLEV